jgi:hypothetical protein
MIATSGMSADPDKQQIPPLRFAPVGMTNYAITFGSGIPALFSGILKIGRNLLT